MSGNVLWVMLYEEHWLAFDLSDPANPKPLGAPVELIGNLDFKGGGTGVSWHVGDGFGILQGKLYPYDSVIDRIYDLTYNPIPDLHGNYTYIDAIPGTTSPNWAVERIFGDTVATRQYFDNREICVLLNCNDPNNPFWTDVADGFFQDTFSVFEITEKWLVTVGLYESKNTMKIFKRPVSLDDEPVFTMEVENWRRNVQIIDEEYMYMANADNHLRILHYTDADGWVELPAITLLPEGYKLIDGWGSIYNNKYYMYARDTENTLGVIVVNVSDPTNPSIVSSYWGNPSESALILATEDISNDLWVAVSGQWNHPSGIDYGEIVIRDPNDLDVELGRIDYHLDGMAQAIDVSGNIAAIAENNLGLLIADISTLPDPPENYTWADTSGKARDIRLYDSPSGLFAYTETENVGVEIFDLANPMSPVKVNELPCSGIKSIDIDDAGTYFAASGTDGVKVWELTDPVNPNYLGLLDTLDGTDGPVWDLEIECNAIWARSNYSLTRYDMTADWPYPSETRGNMGASGDWLNVEWPYIMEGAVVGTGWFDEGTYLIPVDDWLTAPRQEFELPDLLRKVINGSYIYSQHYLGEITYWADMEIYDWHNIPYGSNTKGPLVSSVKIPSTFDYKSGFYNGPDYIVKGNRLYMARGAIDMVVVKLW